VAQGEGMNYGMCDTDSLALLRAASMCSAEHGERVTHIVDAFRTLNPYPAEPWNLDPDGRKKSILEVEDENYEPGTTRLCPPLMFGISSKRYPLFHVKDETGAYLDLPVLHNRQRERRTAELQVILRKVSISGLGRYILPPAPAQVARALVARLWPVSRGLAMAALRGERAYLTMLAGLGCNSGQYELWHAIVTRAVQGDTSMAWMDDLPHFARWPAMYQVTVSTLATYRRFDAVNAGKEYREQVKPFNFCVQFPALTAGFVAACMQQGHLRANADGTLPHVGESFFAPFTREPSELGECRENEDGTVTFLATSGKVRSVKTGEVYTGPLMTLAEKLKAHAHHAESKFLNGEGFAHGMTELRHVEIVGFRYHGKESQGFDPHAGQWDVDETLEYEPPSDDGAEPPSEAVTVKTCLLERLRRIPRAWLAKEMTLSVREIKRICNNKVQVTAHTRDRLMRALWEWEREEERRAAQQYGRQLVKEQDQQTERRKKDARDHVRASGGIAPPRSGLNDLA
jgi:plasmid maintenance system antidote protein VapI